jgi:hypothetical protein
MMRAAVPEIEFRRGVEKCIGPERDKRRLAQDDDVSSDDC